MKIFHLLLFLLALLQLSTSSIASSSVAVQIVRPIDDKLELNRDALRAILLHPDVANRRVMPLAVVGPFRKGKSFVLNFFLRYLSALELLQNNNNSSSNGNGNVNLTALANDEPLHAGFHFSPGSTAHTKGVWMWPHPFLLNDTQGNPIAVLLMDTEGNFDPDKTMQENAQIFALTMFLSSNILLNVQSNIDYDKLQYLQYFARLASQHQQQGGANGTTPGTMAPAFESLTILVRDWMHPTEKPYGFQGGQALIEQNLNLENVGNLTDEVRELRQDIRHHLFHSVQAFLMPHPGPIVAQGQFSGNLSEVDNDFLAEIKVLTEQLFAPANLYPKMLNGIEIDGKTLFNHFESYFALMASDQLTKAATPFDVMANLTLQKNVDRALSLYTECVKKVFGTDADAPPIEQTDLNSTYNQCTNQSLDMWHRAKKFGKTEIANIYQEELAAKINAETLHFGNANDDRKKNLEQNERQKQQENQKKQLERDMEQLERENEEKERERERIRVKEECAKEKHGEEMEKLECERKRLEIIRKWRSEPCDVAFCILDMSGFKCPPSKFNSTLICPSSSN